MLPFCYAVCVASLCVVCVCVCLMCLYARVVFFGFNVVCGLFVVFFEFCVVCVLLLCVCLVCVFVLSF